MLDVAVREARYAACRAQGRFALLATVGSRAYGTDNAGSDWDFKGVYVASHARMFSLAGAQQTLTPGQGDMTIYELAHFCKLAAAANPTVLEVLWADQYEASVLGDMLRRNRDLFLSKRVLQTYGGYAKSQIKKMQEGTGGSRGADHHKRRKFRLHTIRLLFAGIEALRSGTIAVRLTETNRDLVNIVADYDETRFALVASDLFKMMDREAVFSKLPDKPNEAKIDALMYDIRQAAR